MLQLILRPLQRCWDALMCFTAYSEKSQFHRHCTSEPCNFSAIHNNLAFSTNNDSLSSTCVALDSSSKSKTDKDFEPHKNHQEPGIVLY